MFAILYFNLFRFLVQYAGLSRRKIVTILAEINLSKMSRCFRKEVIKRLRI